jgi:GNAT superfamily N-acetyltransferase
MIHRLTLHCSILINTTPRGSPAAMTRSTPIFTTLWRAISRSGVRWHTSWWTPPCIPDCWILHAESFSFSRRQARRRDRDRLLGQYDPVPAVLIGRLAVALGQQGKGIGSVLLYSALVQVLRIRERVGVTAVAAHSIDDAAASIYEHFGFTRFRDEPRHLYYPLATFEASFAAVMDTAADAEDE